MRLGRAASGTAGRRAAVVITLAVMMLAAAGCGSSSTTPAPSASTPTATSAPSTSAASPAGPPSSSASIPDSPVAGVVVAVDSSGLDQVRGFTLRTNTGDTMDFTIGTLENADEFPPGHLKEHQATAAPVLVFFNQVDGRLVVTRIEDAG
jgi:hypothetical protein